MATIVTPPLMSERNEPYAPTWRDCMYAAGLMACWKNGYRGFPLGFGWQEREALERSDHRPDETGASTIDLDAATQNRYGFHLAGVVDLHSALRGPANTGLVVPGNMHVMSSWMKRWDLGFGSLNPALHAVYVQPMGDKLHVRWMDPEATWGYKGDVIDVALVDAYAAYGTLSQQARIAKEPTIVPPSPVTPGVTLRFGGYAGFRGTWKVTGNQSNIRSTPFLNGPVVQVVNAGFIFINAQTTDSGSVVNGSGRWLGDAKGTRWIHVSLVDLVK